MSLTLHQPNLPTTSHPCGQPWHHASNVDISLLLKARDDNDTTTTTSPGSASSGRDRDRDRDQDQDQDTTDTSPSQHSLARTGSLSKSTASTASTSTTHQHLPQPQPQVQQQHSRQQQPSLPTAASHQSRITSSSVIPAKRPASSIHHPSPAKKQSKWSPYEDSKIISLRADGMKWEDISRHLPGRSAISCRLHYQNYLERRSEWDEDRKDRLARLYERFKQEMWAKIAEEMAIPWRAAEAMHWQIGEHDMARRAGVTPFSLSTSSTSTSGSQNGGSGGGGGVGGGSLRPSNSNHSRLSVSRSATGAVETGESSYPRIGTQQLPSLAELTAGLPAFTHPIQPLLPGPGYATYSDSRPPGTPYSSGLPYPGHMITPSPGDLRSGDYFLKRS